MLELSLKALHERMKRWGRIVELEKGGWNHEMKKLYVAEAKRGAKIGVTIVTQDRSFRKKAKYNRL
jgi:hypothetical protein